MACEDYWKNKVSRAWGGLWGIHVHGTDEWGAADVRYQNLRRSQLKISVDDYIYQLSPTAVISLWENPC